MKQLSPRQIAMLKALSRPGAILCYDDRGPYVCNHEPGTTPTLRGLTLTAHSLHARQFVTFAGTRDRHHIFTITGKGVEALQAEVT